MMSKGKKIAAAAVVPLLLALGLWVLPKGGSADEQAYRFAEVQRGAVESVVSATGALSAVTTVQVGTQVSGQIAAIYADFNDPVTKGQLLARIDPTLQEQAVREADASLARSHAELTRARDEHDRAAQLHEQQVITDAEMSSAAYQLAVADANVRSAQVALDRARRNLTYTEIHAPIDGIVVERNVEPGQTVAASLSTPQLFLIAQDLSEMQILASVDESDIALIREGARVRFTVQAYQDRTFEGTVRQVRLQSSTQENVVNYTAVVSVSNPKGALLPGMTATVEFLTASADDVLTVPNAALRFRPTQDMLATAAPQAPGGAGAPAAARGAPAPANTAMIWYLDDAGRPQAASVETGISDGQKTEVRGALVQEGMRVITGVTSGTNAESAANPFQSQGQQGGPRMPGGF